jgi:MFS family permease
MAAEAPAPAPAFDIGKFVGIFAAIGLAIGAIGTALASIFAGFMALAWWKMPLAIFAIMMLISLPSMIIAWLKLRKRNLAPILDANGWAINAKATVNITFGNNLTHLAALPLGSSINFNDPFKSKGMPIWQRLLIAAFIIGIIVYLLVHFGVIHLKAA